MYKDFFEFKLNQPINQEIKELIVYAPRSVHQPLLGKLESMFINGIRKLQETQSSDTEVESESESDSPNPFDKVSALEIVGMLKAIPCEDYNFFPLFWAVFKDLMLSNQICKIKHNNTAMEAGYFDKMSIPDANRLMGEYIKNFFTLSASS